ncbi:hypothetical protein GF420_10305 [candidate division GN15 bacterium]|nr:hypothetical protein [candidate division GN15 bacterium]
MKRTAILVTILTVLALAGNGLTQPYGPTNSFGVRAGFGIDPDQFVFGGQAVLGQVLKVARFSPSVDVGFGDDLTTVVGNVDLRVHLSPPRAAAGLYVGGGPSLAWIDPDIGDSDTEIGFSAAGGLMAAMGQSNMYTLEARVGLGDVPDFRLTVGILFGAVEDIDDE